VRRILLIDDHTVLRQTLALVFDREPGFEVVAQAGSVAEAREMLEGLEDSIDVGVFDLSLPDGEWIELIEELRGDNPDFRALVLTASLDRSDFARAVESGAAGVLHKTAELDEIVGAVRRLSNYEALLSKDELVELLNVASSTREQEREARAIAESITPREREVLQGLADGLSNKEIAHHLHISLDTERTHVYNVLNKIGAHSQLQALMFAVRHRLVELR
jgi:two-component system nitrate/nitrite response regulator NarL